MFSDACSGTDLQVGLFSRKFEVLRRQADGCEWVDLSFRADTRPPAYDHMAVQMNTVTEINISPTSAIRTYPNIGPDLRPVFNKYCGVNIAHLGIHDHRGIGRLGNNRIANPALAVKLPNVAALTLDRDVKL